MKKSNKISTTEATEGDIARGKTIQAQNLAGPHALGHDAEAIVDGGADVLVPQRGGGGGRGTQAVEQRLQYRISTASGALASASASNQ
jgi:hypothetical protein